MNEDVFDLGQALEEHEKGSNKNKLPRINAKNRNLPEMSRLAWVALAQANNPPTMFRYASRFARLTQNSEEGLTLSMLTEDSLRHKLARVAEWVSPKRSNIPNSKEIEWKPDLPPIWLVKDMLVTPNAPLPYLTRIVNHPIFTATGELHIKSGYDWESNCYFYKTEGLTIPTKEEMGRALELLDAPLSDFPFVSQADKAHAIGFMLLPFVRDLIPGPTPIHLFEAPCPGSGKTLCLTVAAYPALGHVVPTTSEGRDEDEWRKRLTSFLAKSPEFVVIDNVKSRLDSGALASAVTCQTWEDRLLGRSETINIPVRCVWAVTGNNVKLSSEIARRAIRIRLDAKMDRPWTREPEQFKYPQILKWVKEHRNELVRAVLTLVQTWITEGQPKAQAKMPTLGMFEDWQYVIGGILEIAGIPGFLSNLEEFYEASDTQGVILRTFIEAWWERFHEDPVITSDLYNLIIEDEIPVFLGRGKTERGQKVYLGQYFLNDLRDRQIGDYRVYSDATYKRAQVWRLVRVGANCSTEIIL